MMRKNKLRSCSAGEGNEKAVHIPDREYYYTFQKLQKEKV